MDPISWLIVAALCLLIAALVRADRAWRDEHQAQIRASARDKWERFDKQRRAGIAGTERTQFLMRRDVWS